MEHAVRNLALLSRAAPSRVTETLPSEASALALYQASNLAWLGRVLFQLGVPLAFVASGASSRLRTVIHARVSSSPGRLAIFIGTYALFFWLLSLPYDYFANYKLLKSFDLSQQTLGRWLELSGLRFVRSLFLQVFALTALLALIPRFPRKFWVLVALGSLPVSSLFVLAKPVYLDPFTHTFRPLTDPQLNQKLSGLASRAGLKNPVFLERLTTVDTATANAEVTGLGGRPRIILWSSLKALLTLEEIEFVVAHEMAHHVLGHRLWGTLLTTLTSLLSLGGAWWFARKLILSRGSRWHLTGLHDHAAVPLLFFTYAILQIGFSIPNLAWSRYKERAADTYASGLIQDPQAGARALRKLQGNNLVHPNPGWLYIWLRGSHPPLGERIRKLEETKGEP